MSEAQPTTFIGADGVEYLLATAIEPKFRTSDQFLHMVHDDDVRRFERRSGSLPKHKDEWEIFRATWTKDMLDVAAKKP